MINKINAFIERLQRYAARPWYIPIVSLSATLDYFILASPAQSLFVSTVVLNPARRVYAALYFSVAAGLGALLLAAGIQLFDAPLEALLTADATASAYWLRLEAWVNAWGLWALLGLSLIPIPLRTMVIIAALAGLSFSIVGLVVLVGRLFALLAVGQIVYHMPGFLMRFALFRRIAGKFNSAGAISRCRQ